MSDSYYLLNDIAEMTTNR